MKLLSKILNSFLFDGYMDSHVRISEKGWKIINDPELARKVRDEIRSDKTKLGKS